MDPVHNLAYPVRSKAAAFRIIDNEAVILNLDNGIYYSLNEVGTRVWELCDGGRTIANIVAAICQEFEVDEETAKKDILELMEDLVKEGLVSINESPT